MDASTEAPPPKKLRRDWRRWGPRAAFECALIVFSVILALALTNWAEDRKVAAEVAEARAFFVAEIRANRQLLASDAFLPHHRRLRRVFNEAAGLEILTRVETMRAYGAMFETGLHLPPLRDAVWRSVGSGELLGEMDLEDVFLLADVYAAQARVMGTHDRFVASLPPILGEIERGEGLRAGVVAGQLSLGDVVASEEGLIRLYDQALARLDPDGETATPRTRDAAPAGG
ncbi:MAG TPA: hypothetical protein VGR32_03335 [Brevundimonas sp.]|jgi:hypothetical protein|uniref:hypothetical protein n=1 Tax=Brevundimonas sp. TaxID=1871086 RepID=UPI002DE794C9|nr:hypothetical protein [Brevundimonas sp.]